MLSGDNSIIKQAGNAKLQTDIAEEKEILEQATVIVMGKSKYGNVEKDKLEDYLTNDVDREIQTTSRGKKIYVEFIDSHRFYSIDTDGNVEELGENYELPTIITASDITENPELYDGKYVTNYDSPNDSAIKDATGQLGKWQILHATENNIYLISSNVVQIENLPNGRNGKSLNKSTSDNYKAVFTDIINDNSSTKYIGSADIVNPESSYSSNLINKTILASLNNDFLTKNPLSTNSNMKAVAYMMDTSVWNTSFKTNRAKFAIGGPSIELLLESYNTCKNKSYMEENNVEKYQAKCENDNKRI